MIKHLSLPPSIKWILNVSRGMENLESIHVNNNYQSNQEGTAIFSKDGSELVCVISSLEHFEISDGVRVIKECVFCETHISDLEIPASVEIIEDGAFLHSSLKNIKFSTGSQLKYLGFNSLRRVKSLIINNENFIAKENVVVMSLNPRGIVFVPKELTELEIDSDVEVIYSFAFWKSSIRSLKLPKSLKKIYLGSLSAISPEITFEEGTELEFIDNAFQNCGIEYIKLPLIVGDMKNASITIGHDVTIELPQNLNPMCERNGHKIGRTKNYLSSIFNSSSSNNGIC